MRWFLACVLGHFHRLNTTADTTAHDAANDALAHRLAGHALECRGVEPLALLGDVGRIPLLAALRALGDGFLASCRADLAQSAARASGPENRALGTDPACNHPKACAHADVGRVLAGVFLRPGCRLGCLLRRHAGFDLLFLDGVVDRALDRARALGCADACQGPERTAAGGDGCRHGGDDRAGALRDRPGRRLGDAAQLCTDLVDQ